MVVTVVKVSMEVAMGMMQVSVGLMGLLVGRLAKTLLRHRCADYANIIVKSN